MASLRSRCLIAILFFMFAGLTLGQTMIDLQWAICDRDAETVLQKLDLEGLEPHKANNITYFDTFPPEYTAKGLAFRTKIHKHEPISMIKVRFDEEIENIPSTAKCVWDRYGEATFYTCSLAFPLADESKPIWSKEQVAFAKLYHSVDFDGLVPYGPFLNPKWKTRIEGHKAVFDDVMAFTGHTPMHIMELEVPAELTKSASVHRKVTVYLKSRGVVICDEPQLPKTLRLFDALDFSSNAESRREQFSSRFNMKPDLKR